jgi:hypothetical protein
MGFDGPPPEKWEFQSSFVWFLWLRVHPVSTSCWSDWFEIRFIRKRTIFYTKWVHFSRSIFWGRDWFGCGMEMGVRDGVWGWCVCKSAVLLLPQANQFFFKQVFLLANYWEGDMAARPLLYNASTLYSRGEVSTGVWPRLRSGCGMSSCPRSLTSLRRSIHDIITEIFIFIQSQLCITWISLSD